MENILLIRLKSIGDVVLTLPAVHAVREQFPAAKITFLTSRENSVLLRGFPEVDKTIVLDREKLRGGNPLKVVPEFFNLLRQLRGGKFSRVLDFQGYGETAWLTRVTGAPLRWGVTYRSSRQWAYKFSLMGDAPVHPADMYLELLRQGGLSVGKIRNEFSLPPDALVAAREFFSGNQLDPAKPTLFIQAFTSGAHKNWPLENYLTVARHWRERGLQILFGGGPADLPALEPAAKEGFRIAAGVPLLVTGGLMQLSTMVLGGDTGALHLAVALGKRVLMLMHRAIPGSPIPYQHPDWIVVAPEPVKIHQISVAEVNAALTGPLAALTGNAFD
jgi:ADP-heptose:LPS heptosyltransferase